MMVELWEVLVSTHSVLPVRAQATMVSDNEVEVVQSAKCGPNFSTAEHCELAKAQVATSEDAVVGANQCSGDFLKRKFNEAHCVLVKECNENVGSNCPLA